MCNDYSIIPANDVNMPRLWRWAEGYLHTCQRTYVAVLIKAGQMQVVPGAIHRPFLTRALKVASYFLVVPGLLAWAVRTGYRRQYNIQRLPVLDRPLQDRFDGFLARVRSKRIAAAAAAPPHFDNSVRRDAFTGFANHALALGRLRSALTNMDTFENGYSEAFDVVRAAMQGVLWGRSDNPDHLRFAQEVCDVSADFLRRLQGALGYDIVNDNYGAWMEGGLGCPSSCEPREGNIRLETLCHLLTQLHRQVAVRTRQADLRDRVRRSPKLRDIPQSVVDRAIRYLAITWLHGTKASVIKSACQLTQGRLLCKGELQGLGVFTPTGESREGSVGDGINTTHLSGVALSQAKVAVQYAGDYQLNLAQERALYQHLLGRQEVLSNPRQSIAAPGVDFAREVEAVRRIQRMEPQRFQADLPQLRRQAYALAERLERELPANAEDFQLENSGPYENGVSGLLQLVAALEDTTQHAAPSAEDLRLSATPAVIGSFTGVGRNDVINEESGLLLESFWRGSATLGDDLGVVFTQPQAIKEVERQLGRRRAGVKVESLDVLDATLRIAKVSGDILHNIMGLTEKTIMTKEGPLPSWVY